MHILVLPSHSHTLSSKKLDVVYKVEVHEQKQQQQLQQQLSREF